MTDMNTRPDPQKEGIDHINTHAKARSQLGKILSPPFDLGEPIHHPILGPFRTVENLWCYLNTGGTRDQMRWMEPHISRNMARLEKKYSCDRFRELILDATLLKLESKSQYIEMMVANELPFDHYYLNGRDRVPIRPGHAALYVSILEEVRDILNGKKQHEFVRYHDMNFTPL